jgi:hypothetical protein
MILMTLRLQYTYTLGCQSGVVVRSMFEINISACHLGGRGFDSRSDPFLMKQRGRFSLTAWVSSGFVLHYKLRNIVYRANNVLVDAQLSIQYF